MSPLVYNTISLTLVISVWIALILAVCSLILMIARWKTPKRRAYLFRFLVALSAIPSLVGIQKGILWLVFLPAISNQKTVDVNVGRAQRLTESSLVRVGEMAPSFSLTTADGDEYSTSGGKVILLNFFATWCGPCQLELPHIERIWTANKANEHFQLLVIGREETTETVLQFRDKNQFSFPIAADPHGKVYSLFARELIPRTIVVSPDGRIVYSRAGFDEQDIDELNSVLREQLSHIR